MRATSAAYETGEYADIAVAELAGDQTYETNPRQPEKALGIGASLVKAQLIRELKHMDMELARLDPAIIAAKKANNPKPGVHQMDANAPSVVPERRNKLTTVEVGKKWCGESNSSGNASVSRTETQTQALGALSGQPRSGDRGLRSSGPLKDEDGDESVLSEDTSDGGVALDARQAFGGKAVMDDFQDMNEDESSREEIGYYYERSCVTDESNALSSEEEYSCVDNGGFNMNDLLVGLGEDTLDDERFERLRRGFMDVLDSTLGLV